MLAGPADGWDGWCLEPGRCRQMQAGPNFAPPPHPTARPQMLTGREAWEECGSPMQIMYSVGVERRRLPIPPGCPSGLAKLLKECWRHNAPLRPTFSEALQRLRQMRAQDSFRLKRPALLKYPADSSAGAGSAGAGSSSSSRKVALTGAGGGRPGTGWSPAFA